MLYREIIAVFLRSIKNIKTLSGQNVEFVDVKTSGAYSEWPLILKELLH